MLKSPEEPRGGDLQCPHSKPGTSLSTTDPILKYLNRVVTSCSTVPEHQGCRQSGCMSHVRAGQWLEATACRIQLAGTILGAQADRITSLVTEKVAGPFTGKTEASVGKNLGVPGLG